MKYNSRKTDARLPVHGYAGLPVHFGGDIIDVGQNEWQNIVGTEANRPQIGTKVCYNDGREFVYVQMTGGAAALGTVLEQAAVVAEDTVSSSSDLLRIENMTGLTAGAHVGDFAYIDEGTGEGQCRRIVANGTTWLELDRPLVTALAIADSDVTIIRPFRVIAATAAVTTPVAGVSVGVITQNYYGWMQTKGICEHVLVDDTATVAGQYMVVDDAAAGKGRGIGATVDVEDQRFFAIALAANVSTTVPATLLVSTSA